MALTDGDRNWMQDRFDRHTEKLDAFQEKFEQHRLDDQLTSEGMKRVSLALQTHLDSHEKSEVRKRRSWVFWAGIAAALLAPILAMVVEHYFFFQHIIEKVKK